MTAYANSLPTTSTVNNLIDSKNITQDITNFGTFAVRSDTYTKSAVDTIVSNQAATTASTFAPQSSTYTKTQVDAIETNINTALATASTAVASNATNITATQVEVILLQSGVTANSAQGNASATTLANVVSGSQALASADITGNAIIGGTLQAAGIMSTGSFLGGSWAAFGSIPLNPQTGSIYAQQLSTTGNVTCAGSLFVGGVQVTPGGASASAGDVLKSSRIPITVASYNMKNSWYTVFNHAHTPSDASCYLDVTFTGLWRLMPTNQGNQNGEWRISVYVDNTSIGDCFIRNDGAAPVGNSGPLFGRYTNTSLASKTVSVRAIQTNHFQTSKFYLNYTHQNSSNWLHIEEVKR